MFSCRGIWFASPSFLAGKYAALRRDCLFLLHLGHMCALVGNIMPQRCSQLLVVVGEDLRVVCAARDEDIGHAVVEQILRGKLRIHVDQNTLGGLPWLEWLVTAYLSLWPLS